MSADTVEPDTEGEIDNGDEWPWSAFGDWVVMANISDLAVRCYCMLRAYANKSKEKGAVSFPSQATLATIFGRSKPDEIGKAMKELEAIGAISRKVTRGPRGWKTVYRTYKDQPRPGVKYDGPVYTSDLTAEALETMRQTRIKRRPTRTKAALAAKESVGEDSQTG